MNFQIKNKSLRFAYLNLKDHPRGNCILTGLLESGYIPGLIIEEHSSLSIKSYSTLTTDLKQFDISSIPLSTAEIIARYQLDPRIHTLVSNQNDDRAQNLLSEFQPDLIVLGDTRIIKDKILKIPTHGIINTHPGFLPYVRGNNPYIWAIFYGLPFGCSVHFINAGIDTGDLIFREEIDYRSLPNYSAMLAKLNESSTRLMVNALTIISSGNICPIPQDTLLKNGDYPETFSLAPPEIKQKVKEMFNNNFKEVIC